jgi:hypothetical protein
LKTSIIGTFVRISLDASARRAGLVGRIDSAPPYDQQKQSGSPPVPKGPWQPSDA